MKLDNFTRSFPTYMYFFYESSFAGQNDSPCVTCTLNVLDHTTVNWYLMKCNDSSVKSRSIGHSLKAFK